MPPCPLTRSRRGFARPAQGSRGPPGWGTRRGRRGRCSEVSWGRRVVAGVGVVGEGGLLDAARYRTFVSRELGVSIRDVYGFVLGGHTDTTMVPIVSKTMVGGIPLTALLGKDKIQELVERTMRGG